MVYQQKTCCYGPHKGIVEERYIHLRFRKAFDKLKKSTTE